MANDRDRWSYTVAYGAARKQDRRTYARWFPTRAAAQAFWADDLPTIASCATITISHWNTNRTEQEIVSTTIVKRNPA